MIVSGAYRALSVNCHRHREQKNETQQDFQVTATDKNRLAAALRVAAQSDAFASLFGQARFERQTALRQHVEPAEAQPFWKLGARIQ